MGRPASGGPGLRRGAGFYASGRCSDLGQAGVGIGMLLLDGGPEAVCPCGGGRGEGWGAGGGRGPSLPQAARSGAHREHSPGGLGALGVGLQALWCRSKASAAATGPSRPRPRPRPRTAASSGPAGRQGPLGWGLPGKESTAGGPHPASGQLHPPSPPPHPPWVGGGPGPLTLGGLCVGRGGPL